MQGSILMAKRYPDRLQPSVSLNIPEDAAVASSELPTSPYDAIEVCNWNLCP